MTDKEREFQEWLDDPVTIELLDECQKFKREMTREITRGTSSFKRYWEACGDLARIDWFLEWTPYQMRLTQLGIVEGK